MAEPAASSTLYYDGSLDHKGGRAAEVISQLMKRIVLEAQADMQRPWPRCRRFCAKLVRKAFRKA